MRIYAGSDHAGFSLRRIVVERLRAQGKDVVDLGTDSDAACDYPEFAHAVANKVRSEPSAVGILACATGQGMAMAAGKVRGIRAALPLTVEAARLSRIDNNANVLCLAGRILSEADACAMVDTWLATSFAGGRHARRIAKVAAIETASAVAFVMESERLYLAGRGVPAKLFAQDPSLFSNDPVAHGSIRRGMGFVSLPQAMGGRLSEMTAFADQVRQAGLKDAVLLVDAEEEAAIATLAHMWGTAGMRLHVAHARAPDALAGLEGAGCLDATLVLVCSRTARIGEDLRANEERLQSRMVEHRRGDAQRAGQQFVALTTDGSDLVELAAFHRYAKVFLDPVDTGGGFGVLGFAGLLPALLAGIDPARLLERVRQMSEACRSERLEDNPGASLGVLLGSMAKHGRRRVTLLASKSLEPLAEWISLLLAQATRHAERSIVVCRGEPLQTSYPPDRVFVHLQAAGDPSAIASQAMETLHIAGQPYIQILVADKFQIAAELFRWQVAAAVAAIAMATNPFAEPAACASAPSGHPAT